MTAPPAPSYAEAPPNLIAGALGLDFVNTLDWRGDPTAPGERLLSYAELALWAMHAGALGRGEGRRLQADARRRPAEAEAVRREAIALREALAQLFGAPRAHHAAPLARVNGLLARAPARTALAGSRDGYIWSTATATPLEQPLWPVLWSAAELLTSSRLGRVRRCGDPRCGWMFLDTSRNGSRRWCAMEDCGNRAKARRHSERRRSVQGTRSAPGP